VVTRKLPKGFLLIDISKRCLIDGARVDRFLALSYVWGENSGHVYIETRKENVDALRVPGALAPSKLPTTIEDAIQTCIILDERYLWVDRLCIVQDDLESKQQQIESMAAIYSSAFLVLIAAYGDNMDFGLAGVSWKRPVSTKRKTVSGIPVASNVINSVEDPYAKWLTRAWTYQEAVLATRRLWFYSNQASLECAVCTFDEDICTPVFSQRQNPEDHCSEYEDYRRVKQHRSGFDHFLEFSNHLYQYASLELTRDYDVYNAFSGISSVLYPGNDALIYGLPRQHFEFTLLWYMGPDACPRTPEHPELILPSWSWSSYKLSVVDFQHIPRSSHPIATLVVWYTQHSAQHKSLRAVKAEFTTKMHKDLRIMLAIACKYRCITAITVPESTDSRKFVEYLMAIRDDWPEYDAFVKGSVPQGINEQFWSLIRPGVLYSRSQSAVFNVRLFHGSFCIFTEQGDWVGMLSHMGAELVPDIAPFQLSENAGFEFIGISVSAMFESEIMEKFTPPLERPTLAAHIPELVPEELVQYLAEGKESLWKAYTIKDGNVCPVVDVMLITRRGQFARRLHVGWIFFTYWIKAKRTTQEIFLE